MTARSCVVTRAGMLTTVQDLGRPGQAHLAVPHSGAADRPAHLLANRLVGNPAGAATLETTLTGVALRFGCPAWVAVTGAVADVSVDDRSVHWGIPLRMEAGQTLDVGPAVHGLRSYVAVDGGFAVDPELGSRSHDVLSHIGPQPLVEAHHLPLGRAGAPPEPLHFAPWPVPAARPVLAVDLGPRDDWFTRAALHTLFDAEWTVTQDCDRIGVRLAGPHLARARSDELPSEGTVVGAVEVPSGGQPLIFLADHPTTIGYPTIATLRQESVAACAQLRPGQPVRFAPARA
ncbi:MAG TPA: biotin-dependent carboxyltransferase family protein [Jatrophihabitans sp.]|nr:biotin-dependent carboxyltransferase family protein [Jatrophihabitans sp.]